MSYEDRPSLFACMPCAPAGTVPNCEVGGGVRHPLHSPRSLPVASCRPPQPATSAARRPWCNSIRYASGSCALEITRRVCETRSPEDYGYIQSVLPHVLPAPCFSVENISPIPTAQANEQKKIQYKQDCTAETHRGSLRTPGVHERPRVCAVRRFGTRQAW